MLYDEKIEALISAALTDGVLTEKEKQVLFKKAQADGIDLDEFEMVLDARLVELEKAEKEKAEKSAPKSTKYGDVRKCPVCGAMVPALAGVCPECGYEFSGVDANLTSKKLADKIEQVTNEWDSKINALQVDNNDAKDKKWEMQKAKEQAIAQAILSIPIPITKSDLYEFMTVTQAAFLSQITPYYSAEAYHTKYQEALIKARQLFPNDETFRAVLDENEEVQAQYQVIHKKQPKISFIKPSIKFILGLLIGMIIMVIILLINES